MLVALEAWASKTVNDAAWRAKVSLFQWPGIYIISAQRSPRHNKDVGGAPDSLHLRCPSLAVDIRVGGVATGDAANPILDWLGARWMTMGGRWGGLFSSGPDRPHFDLGAG